MADNVQVNIDEKILECPIIVGTEGDKAFDIGKLRASSNYITMDPGFGNTGSCKSAIGIPYLHLRIEITVSIRKVQSSKIWVRNQLPA